MLALVAITCIPHVARALDKQGSAHGGAVGDEGPDDKFDVSGALTLGSAIVDPTYAARPDNTGLALFRYAGHADVDLIGRKLSIPLDVNLFTDRLKKGAGVLVPTELDLIGGVTTTFDAGPGDLELGARLERDMPIDRGGFSQTYVDVRGRYLYSLAKVSPGLRHSLVDGDISGAVTLGAFAFNPTYAARPDNSGLALFRYGLRTELSVWHDHWSVAADLTSFTDREASVVVAPSEADVTYEVIARFAPYELHLAYERDMPLDRNGLVQSFVYALAVWSFDLVKDEPKPLMDRGTIPSP